MYQTSMVLKKSSVQSLLNRFVFYRLHISVCSLCALWCSSNILSVTYSISTWLIVSLSITLIYQLNRLSDVHEDSINSPVEHEINVQNQDVIIGASRIMTVLILTLALFSPVFIKFLIPLIAMGLAYNFRLIGKYRLKNVLIIKNIVSAFGWSFSTMLLPELANNYIISPKMLYLFAYMFLGVMSSEVIWDLRDMEGDRSANIRTMPITFGRRRTYMFITLLNLTGIAIISYGILSGILNILWATFILNNVASLVWICFLSNISFNRKVSHQLLGLQILVLIVIALIFQ